ncbi:MAG: hypothetical protein EPO25_07970 [Gammaproteobacteria bacterium]|nr:MAG: hypothetical protein EPO25_07970 [Gammaproteobacteria bacterium]
MVVTGHYASWKERKLVATALKEVYRAPDTDAATTALDEFAEGPWGRKYPAITAAWRRNWEQVIPFFAYPPEVRRIMYTTDEINKPSCVWRWTYPLHSSLSVAGDLLLGFQRATKRWYARSACSAPWQSSARMAGRLYSYARPRRDPGAGARPACSSSARSFFCVSAGRTQS